jgi:hypothetical protein
LSGSRRRCTKYFSTSPIRRFGEDKKCKKSKSFNFQSTFEKNGCFKFCGENENILSKVFDKMETVLVKLTSESLRGIPPPVGEERFDFDVCGQTFSLPISKIPFISPTLTEFFVSTG